MNFDYIKDAQPKTQELQELYASLYKDIEDAEDIYWTKPAECGMLLRRVTEKICHVYNSFYQVGYPADASLEDFLCYTNEEAHNVMVSRFLSVIRSEQRDHLEWLRVWGDECALLDKNPEELQKHPDKIFVLIRKMMSSMLEVTREMCEKLDHMEDLDDWIFEDYILPGYVSEDDRIEYEEQKKKEEKKKRGLFSFLRKNKEV